MDKWDSIDPARQRKCLEEIMTRIGDIDDVSTVGVIAAQDIIDIVTENLAPEIYNRGIADAKKLLEQKFADIEVELGMLERETV